MKRLGLFVSLAAVALLTFGVAACAGYTAVDAMLTSWPAVSPPEIVTAMSLAAAVAPASASLDATEALGAKGATHPRVSLEDINAAIDGEYYFSALDGVDGHYRGGPEAQGCRHAPQLGLLTMCVLVIKNGFTIIGKSAPASPENFDAEKGRTFAREDAVRQLWPLMGFALRERLAEPKAA